MTVSRQTVATAGERMAAAMLEGKGYSIERNLRSMRGELDLVAQDSEGVLVFVEVEPAEAVMPAAGPRVDQSSQATARSGPRGSLPGAPPFEHAGAHRRGHGRYGAGRPDGGDHAYRECD